MLVSFRRRLVHPSLCASCLYKSMLYTVPCDIGAIILFSFLYMYIYIFLGPLVGRRSSLFRSNSHFRFPLITYSSYIMPFGLLPSWAFISRWKYQFSSDHWSQATSSVVSTWMGDRLGTPRNAHIFIILFLRSTLSLLIQLLATSISESTRATTQTMRTHCLFSSVSVLEKNSPRILNAM